MTNLLLIGCYTPPMGDGRGLSVLALEQGELRGLGLVALTESPSFLITAGPIVYVVNEAVQGRVTSFRYSGDTDPKAQSGSITLQQLAVQNTGGAHPCHLAIDPSGSVLAAANYSSGSVSLHRLDGAGGIEPAATVLQLRGSGPVSDRQEAAHAHQVVFGNGLMHVVDLGSDRIWRYELDPAALAVTEVEPWRLPAGFGPRQLVLAGADAPDAADAEDTADAYVLGELSNDLALLRGGELVSIRPAFGAPVPAGNLAATLLRLDDGRLLVSHRGADRLCLFQCAGDALELLDEFPSVAAGPRYVTDGIFVAGQLSNTVAWLAADGTVRSVATTPTPTCVVPI
ncbi:MAG TPA: beta-propeller fold lactonase family protein [Jatrophihabitans sp.]|nr:beta-propeller fold lactonase family protein [Jatrophihabitans sp.]